MARAAAGHAAGAHLEPRLTAPLLPRVGGSSSPYSPLALQPPKGVFALQPPQPEHPLYTPHTPYILRTLITPSHTPQIPYTPCTPLQVGAALLVASYLLLLCGGAAALLLGLVGGAARHAEAHEEAYALYRARWVLRAEGSLLGQLLRTRQLRCGGHDHAYTPMEPPPDGSCRHRRALSC